MTPCVLSLVLLTFLMMIIRKQFRFEAAHRLPNHTGKCGHLHGHSYLVEIAIEGAISLHASSPSEGMVMDFAELRPIKDRIDIHRDHAFIGYKDDQLTQYCLDQWWRVYVLDYPPTAEMMAQHLGELFMHDFPLHSITLWETETSSVVWNPIS